MKDLFSAYTIILPFYFQRYYQTFIIAFKKSTFVMSQHVYSKMQEDFKQTVNYDLVKLLLN